MPFSFRKLTGLRILSDIQPLFGLYYIIGKHSEKWQARCGVKFQNICPDFFLINQYSQ